MLIDAELRRQVQRMGQKDALGELDRGRYLEAADRVSSISIIDFRDLRVLDRLLSYAECSDSTRRQRIRQIAADARQHLGEALIAPIDIYDDHDSTMVIGISHNRTDRLQQGQRLIQDAERIRREEFSPWRDADSPCSPSLQQAA